MSLRVKTFNDNELSQAIKEYPKIVQEYIKAQKDFIDMDFRNMQEFSKKWQRVPPDIQNMQEFSKKWQRVPQMKDFSLIFRKL